MLEKERKIPGLSGEKKKKKILRLSTRNDETRERREKIVWRRTLIFFSSSFIFSARWLVMIHFQPLNERLDVDRSPTEARHYPRYKCSR